MVIVKGIMHDTSSTCFHLAYYFAWWCCVIMIKEVDGWICHYCHETACDGIVGTAQTFKKWAWVWTWVVLAAGMRMTEINGIADKHMGRLNHRHSEKKEKKKRTKKEKNVFHIPFSVLSMRQKGDKLMQYLVSSVYDDSMCMYMQSINRCTRLCRSFPNLSLQTCIVHGYETSAHAHTTQQHTHTHAIYSLWKPYPFLENGVRYHEYHIGVTFDITYVFDSIKYAGFFFSPRYSNPL